MSCQYKDLFGKVGEGVHSYRIFNIAVVDVLLTVLLAFVIYILIFLFVLGFVLHRIFCLRTTVDKLLFGSL